MEKKYGNRLLVTANLKWSISFFAEKVNVFTRNSGGKSWNYDRRITLGKSGRRGGTSPRNLLNLFRENGILKDTMAGEQYESQKMERGSVK